MSTFMWLITGAGILAALMVVHEWRQGHVPSPLLAALYSTFSKLAEAAFLSWLTVACMTGHAGEYFCVNHHLPRKPVVPKTPVKRDNDIAKLPDSSLFR